VNYEALGIFVIFLIILIPLPTYAQNTQICGTGTILDNSTGQCILQCGEGTNFDGDKCVEDSKGVDFGQIEAIAVGIIGGLVATAFGIWWTVKTRKEERTKEDLEIIQNYGNQLSEITQEEEDLETKLDCSLYADRYLDTLDQMASLLAKGLIRLDVADYFENQFKYGMNLWFWYKENIEKNPKKLLKDKFGLGVGKFEKSKDKKPEDDSDRWYWFRWWCYAERDIFDYSFMKIRKKKKDPKEKLDPFEPQPRKELVKQRLDLLKAIKNPSKETSIRIEILDDLHRFFSGSIKTDEKNTDEKNIYDRVMTHIKKLEPDS